MSVKLSDNPNIPGIPTYAEGAQHTPGISTYAEGAQLSFSGYKDILAPPKYEFEGDYENGTAFAKVHRKGKTLYISIAGTDHIPSDARDNWTTIGYGHFERLDPQLGPIIEGALKLGENVVVLGDSGGGLAAQFFRYKYGTDIFVTNTFRIPELSYTIFTKQTPNTSSRAIALNLSGELLSRQQSKWPGFSVFYAPSELDAKILLRGSQEGSTLFYAGSKVDLHMNKDILAGKYGDLPLQNRPWILDDYLKYPITREFIEKADEDLRKEYERRIYQINDGTAWRDLLINREQLIADNKEIIQLCINNNYYDTIST